MSPNSSTRAKHWVCRRDDLPAGGRLLVTVEGRSIGLFESAGRIYAIHNRCPHMGGALCAGRVGGTTLPTDRYEFVYGRDGSVLRCAWHGWEFDLTTGESILDVRLRAKTFDVEVEGDHVYLAF